MWWWRIPSWLGICDNSDYDIEAPFRGIIILDFDLTITNLHSGGTAKPDGKYINKDNIQVLNDLFVQMKNNRIPVFINTRGVASMVKDYMMTIGMWTNICAIYGARNDNDVGAGEREWSYRKKTINKMILKRCGWDTDRMGSCRDHAYFYDDTKINITESNDILTAIVVNNVRDTIGKLTEKLNELMQKDPVNELTPPPHDDSLAFIIMLFI